MKDGGTETVNDTDNLWSIDAPRWGVEIADECGWVRVMETTSRDLAIRRARDERAERPESGVDVVAVDDDGISIDRFDIGTISEI
jgi:hypothetical protein